MTTPGDFLIWSLTKTLSDIKYAAVKNEILGLANAQKADTAGENVEDRIRSLIGQADEKIKKINDAAAAEAAALPDESGGLSRDGGRRKCSSRKTRNARKVQKKSRGSRRSRTFRR